MPKFSVPGNKGTANVRTIVNARSDGTTLASGKVWEYSVGSIASADASFDHEIYRATDAGTAAALTPNPLDFNDTAAIFDASDTYTTDPTITAVLMRFGMHQRASWRWVAGAGDELMWPNLAADGICGGLAATSTTDFSGTLMADSI